MKNWVPAALVICALLSGCVSKATYQAKIDEKDQVELALQNLESSYQDLDLRFQQLLAAKQQQSQELEEGFQKNTVLQQDLLRARADIERLESVLSSRSAEAGAAMAQMRQTIDGLEEQNRELNNQLEKEKLAREARIAQMKSTYDELVGMLESEISRGEVTISELQGKLTVNMVEKILFDSGEAELKQDGQKVLQRVGDILKNVADKTIRVEGHTDNVPISARLKATFPTNWELSTARAINVVHFLQGPIGIAGNRLSACGFGPYQPVSDNATSEGRAQNRRIQIVLVPLEDSQPQPPQ